MYETPGRGWLDFIFFNYKLTPCGHTGEVFERSVRIYLLESELPTFIGIILELSGLSPVGLWHNLTRDHVCCHMQPRQPY